MKFETEIKLLPVALIGRGDHFQLINDGQVFKVISLNNLVNIPVDYRQNLLLIPACNIKTGETRMFVPDLKVRPLHVEYSFSEYNL